MFIKLTRFDNRPIWLNASFIVTVEPRKDGAGSVVVPIGDGFDYDVRESVAEILEKLEGAPMATVVPVPTSDCLTKTPAVVSPEPGPMNEKPATEVSQPETPPVGKKPRKRAVRKPKAEGANVEKASAKKEKPLVSLELTPDQIVRLGKLAPKSLSKLKNTLATQFHIADVGATVQALEAKGTFTLDGAHVVWSAPATVEAAQM